jgi:hypothetical protein
VCVWGGGGATHATTVVMTEFPGATFIVTLVLPK